MQKSPYVVGKPDLKGFSMTVPVFYDDENVVPILTSQKIVKPQAFAFDAHKVRVLQINSEPWFVAADVCEVLDIQNVAQAVTRLDDDERSMFNIGRQGDAHIINESGLYSLTLTSRKPDAKRFKKWITAEVLPMIRKTGRYGIQVAPAVPQSLSAALRLAADQAEQIEQIEQQQVQLDIAAPKAAFVDAYVESSGLKGFRQVAKLLKANEARLRKFLSDKIMYLLGGEWHAYQHHIDAGRFSVRTGTNPANQHTFNRSLFTPKGIEWLAGLWAVHCLKGDAA